MRDLLRSEAIHDSLAIPPKPSQVQGLSPAEATKNASISCGRLLRSNHWADKSSGFESLPSIGILGRLTGRNLPDRLAYHHRLGTADP